MRADRETLIPARPGAFGLHSIVWAEIRHRPGRLVSGLLAVTLGVAAIVGIKSVTDGSVREVAKQLDLLGANILVLPAEASLENYYSADIDAPTFTEDYVERIVTSMLPGVDNLSPKLSRRISVNGKSVVLTGILPANELAAKPAWQSYSLSPMAPANMCGGARPPDCAKTGGGTGRTVDSLDAGSVWAGSLAAKHAGLQAGKNVTIEGRPFKVERVLPETGTVDDNRVFANLHAVQKLLGTGRKVNAIEIMGCCAAISEGLLGKLRNILPDTRVVTIAHIVRTQTDTNRLLGRVTIVLVVIVFLVGAVAMGNYMWADVEERRRELGVFVTVGFRRSQLESVFLAKAVLLGVGGGLLGWILGTACAAALGPVLAGIRVSPAISYLAGSVALAVAIAVCGSWIPISRAVRFDPAANMQER
jgi:putative ABC transport system permease protein